jgi:hypothetical protein
LSWQREKTRGRVKGERERQKWWANALDHVLKRAREGLRATGLLRLLLFFLDFFSFLGLGVL